MIETLKITLNGKLREIYRVTATQNELNWAIYAGILRHQEAVANNRTRPDGTQSTYDDDITGSIGEFIVSLALGLPWRGPGSFRGDDIVGGFEVRATHNYTNGRLIIRPTDSNTKPFIFVRGTVNPLVWHVYGWIHGNEGKLDMFKEGKIYYVEKEFLRPITELNVREQVS